MEFKNRIKELRIEKNLTQRELADALGVSSGLIGMYETGKRKPSYEMEELLADFFNVEIAYLRGSSDVRTIPISPTYVWKDADIEVIGKMQCDEKLAKLLHTIVRLDDAQITALLIIVESFKK